MQIKMMGSGKVRLFKEDIMRILVVGGVAGGASAAAKARRLSEDAEIVIFERGEHISFANCGLPYHIGGVIKERERLLVQTPEAMRKRFRIDVRVRTEVVKIDRESRAVMVRDLRTGKEQREPYDALILSPGAEPLRPPIPGVRSPRVHTLRTMVDMDAIKSLVDAGRVQKALIVGGGYIGLEMAEALRERKLSVTLVELKDQVMVAVDPEMAALLHQELILNGVDLRLGTSVKAFDEADNSLRIALSTGEHLDADLALLAIGMRPEVSLARDAGLKIGGSGGIFVDARMRTSDPAIYAVGDAVEVDEFVTGGKVVIPLAGPANRQGRIAAEAVFGMGSEYKKTQGTAICKVFGLAVGMTGVNEKQLKVKGLRFEAVHIHPADHAGYYPGATPLTMKMLFDPSDGRILGAQAVGRSGVDKRIDVLAVAIRAGLTVRDLKDIELSYAPPYGSAKDPVNYLGFVAANVMDGQVKLCHTDDIANLRPDQAVLDVRTKEEVALGKIPGALNIPLDELRGRLSELPSMEFLVYCRVGLRGYLTCRILMQNGFSCRNLSGGFLTYEARTGKMSRVPAAPRDMKDDHGAQQQVPDRKGTAMLKIDACGLQCPGPIIRIKEALDKAENGDVIEITATDPGFLSDVKAWCQSTGHELRELRPMDGRVSAVICKRETSTAPAVNTGRAKTLVVFSSDLDKVIASFVIANGAAAMGSRVTMFFTFWGLNALRRSNYVKVRKTLIEKMFGWMMPRGAGKLTLSRMHMAGAGTWMIKDIMRRKNVSSLPEFMGMAQSAGVRLVACTMSMDLMGIKKEELIDGVETGGVAMYLQQAEQGNVNLFI
jgi:NADPH-dependent 2,4-dienoyl-CoA reductase/sulfur reductase-like enzyme/peroxiredoxin family protein/TusA-related sulfurtransferase/rhodanese-related sulfurtransferase